MEQIIIQGLQLPTIIGVYDWERTQPQTLIVDLVITADVSAACHSDDVNDTLDYAKLSDELVELAKQSQCELLEAFASAICDTLMAYKRITQVDVTVEKPNILSNARRVAVRLVRVRQ
ncbi:dihydroneopterin aldolase [Alteromonas sp. ASW11-36]|uniref:7,8-dihydroneopterin aldolase n=1 Tax=Alteromonas arenosi TaxID=3055817 RepID=A0ABT7SZX0_9ALTE|nr:dihydroneopterin aldolase [Alteromonas sp. ASW11-36]MDM7861741.1 dihydroneopterin aldolase [Alteromonas sp. ASW11-36]